MTRHNLLFPERIFQIRILTCIAFMVIGGRLLYLQIALAHYFTSKCEKNFTRSENVKPARGDILDSTGNLIATNQPVVNVCWRGTGNRRLTEEQKQTVLQLLTIITSNKSADEMIQMISGTERRYGELVLAHDINHEQLSRIEELLGTHPNVLLKTGFRRYYPHGTHASHILGYLNQQDGQTTGRYGLERQMDAVLKGESGLVTHTINSRGKRIAQLQIIPDQTGATVQTTLNMKLQALCENVFPPGKSGSIIMMNPNDGAIHALLSHPNFDPNLFLRPIAPSAWELMQQECPFINRALGACYPPGSIFNLITISAALEQGLIKPNDTWQCIGYNTVGQRKYWCHKHDGHGEISITQAVALSCNTLFFEFGKQLDIDLLAQYARIFGIGTPTRIVLPESTGLMPTTQWKETVKHEQWWPGETLSVTIGQSFVLTTPMQVARMIGGICTGQLVKPRILTDEAVEHEALALQPKTIKFLKRSMRKVIRHDTDHRTSRMLDIELYTKTSTTQLSSMREQSDNEKTSRAWLVCCLLQISRA